MTKNKSAFQINGRDAITVKENPRARYGIWHRPNSRQQTEAAP